MNEMAENACRWEEVAEGEQWGPAFRGWGPVLSRSQCAPASLPAWSQLLPGGPQTTHVSHRSVCLGFLFPIFLLYF